jgi:putative addiction module component (TIGR02574 family)
VVWERRATELERYLAVHRGPEPCYGSSMSTEELLAQVLLLPRHERARLAEEVLSSLEEPDLEEVAAAWTGALERRAREVAEGKVQTVGWGTVRAEILKELEDRRAGLLSSALVDAASPLVEQAF